MGKEYVAAPEERFHGLILEKFHELRKKKGDTIYILISGTELNEIVYKAKNEVYYPVKNTINTDTPKPEIVDSTPVYRCVCGQEWKSTSDRDQYCQKCNEKMERISE
jgi:hypothetical protein